MEIFSLNKTSINWLYDAARWSRFIAILGFIMIGFLVFVGIIMGPVLSVLNEDMDISSDRFGLSSGIIAAIYIMIAVLYFFPIYYLFQFSQGIIKAYKTNNEDILNTSFRFLKSHYKFIGIMLIVVLATYFVAFGVGTIALIAK
ncbi:MAG: hypothetical protein PF484_09820 [Bacteroidales bacterium]|jgi:hypothetical protein|nr:hypothetical protein [Bacteroidales bacterium]